MTRGATRRLRILLGDAARRWRADATRDAPGTQVFVCVPSSKSSMRVLSGRSIVLATLLCSAVVFTACGGGLEVGPLGPGPTPVVRDSAVTRLTFVATADTLLVTGGCWGNHR